MDSRSFASCLLLLFLKVLSVDGSNEYNYGVCPLGYQLLKIVNPPLSVSTISCTYFEPPSCSNQCYWANQGDTGPYVFGVHGRGDCGSNTHGTSDQYNIGVGTLWAEGTKAVYIAGINVTTTTDQKYCCVSDYYKVKSGSCAGGSTTNGGYKFASSGSGDIPPTSSLDIATISGTPRTNPIVRQFDDNFKYDPPTYDYVMYICDTEVDPAATCAPTTTTTATTPESCSTAPSSPTDGICPVGYQMLSTVDPPVISVTQTCTYYEPASCVDQCYWANQGDTGQYVFGEHGRGDCGSNFYPTSDQYNIGVGTLWAEGTRAVYVAGINISATTDQKYCCVSNKYLVTSGGCTGGSANNGGYKYSYSGTGDIPPGTLDATTLGKTNPIVRQFDDNFKYDAPDYDYTIYICSTEVDPSSTCDTGTCAPTTTTTTTSESCSTAPSSPTDGICPVGYQMLSTVNPPVISVTQMCTYYEPASCVDQCYWANQGDTGPYVFGEHGRGDCGSNFYATSDQYNIGVGTLWAEGTKAVYLAGINISATTDQKYCCVSNKYLVTSGGCAGGSANNGGYKYSYSGTGDIPPGTLDATTLGKTNPIVRQFDDNFKYDPPDYDYTIYICSTEVDPSSTCDTGTCASATTTTSTACSTAPSAPTDGICPSGYQMLSTVNPPVISVTQTCTYYEPASCVDQCYWANQGDTGPYVFGVHGETVHGVQGDCRETPSRNCMATY